MRRATPRFGIILIVLLAGLGLLLAHGSVRGSSLVPASDSATAVRTPTEKVDQRLYQIRDAMNSRSLASVEIEKSFQVHLHGDSVQVEVLLRQPLDEAIRLRLSGSGGRIEIHHQQWVQMVVPLLNLEWFNGCADVISAAIPARSQPSEYTSEGLGVIRATNFHKRGYYGAGVSIAVVDVGFLGYSSYVGSELPISMTAASFRADGVIDGVTDHGTMCAQIIHDVAPQAELMLLAYETRTEFLALLDWVPKNGFQVVSCSNTWLTVGWPDGTSEISQRVSDVSASGTVWVNAVGNNALAHWSGTFSDPDADSWHNFSGAVEQNQIQLNAGDRIQLSLIWNNWPLTYNDYNLYLVNASGVTVSSATNVQIGSEPREVIDYLAATSGSYYVRIQKVEAAGDAQFHLYCLVNGSATSVTMQYSNPEGSVTIPADANNAIAVGAVRWNSTTVIESYSSRGPTGDGRIKPDFVAPTCVSVAPGVTFCGTSASCPHVAGAAVLYLDYSPDTPPTSLISVFQSLALDLGAPGKDNVFGWGLLQLPALNAPPILTNPGSKSVREGWPLNFTLQATDPDGDVVTFRSPALPKGASLSSSGSFSWLPNFIQAGTYPVMFIASDGTLADSEQITITVEQAGNQRPVLAAIGPKSVKEGENLNFGVSASDPDSTVPYLNAYNLPVNASFVDHHNGTGTFNFNPDTKQGGVYHVTFAASDESLADTEIVEITVTETNLPPVLTPIGSQSVKEGDSLIFVVAAIDPDGTAPVVTSGALPTNASFTPLGGGTARFAFGPDYSQAGEYRVWFFAADAADLQLRDSEEVAITVVNTNRPPAFVSTFSDTEIVEDERLSVHVRAVDPDGDGIFLGHEFAPDGEVFADSGNGAAHFAYGTSYRDVDSTYLIRFTATDRASPEVAETLYLTVKNRQLQVTDVQPQPLPEASDMLIDAVIYFEFNEAIDTASLTRGVFLQSAKGDTLSPVYDAAALRLYVFHGSDYFREFDTITVSMNLSLLDLAGHPLGNSVHKELRTGTSVYPGDTDNDGFVDERDVLPLGVFWGLAGATRGEAPDLEWRQSPAHVWATPAATYADADGSGRVDALDICAIIANWGAGRPMRTGSTLSASLTADEVGMVFEDSTLEALRKAVVDCPDGEGKQAVIRMLEGWMRSESEHLPADYDLDQNFPNPFNPFTVIRYTVMSGSHVELTIYDVLGRTIRTFVDDPKSGGTYSLIWDGTDDKGACVATGVYFYRLSADGFVQTRKMMLLK